MVQSSEAVVKRRNNMRSPRHFRPGPPPIEPPWPLFELGVAGIMLSLAFGLFCMHDAGNLSDAEFAAALGFMAGVPFGVVMCIDEKSDGGCNVRRRPMQGFPPIDVYTISPSRTLLSAGDAGGTRKIHRQASAETERT